MATVTRPMPDGTALRNRFAALRNRLRFVALWRGAGWLAAITLGVLIVFGTADFFLPLFPLVRAVILCGTLAAAGLVAWKLLVVPLSEPMDDLSLALKVEERHPTLNDALASTVQFLDQPKGPDGESAPMKHEAVRRTLGRVTGLDFNRIVDARGMRGAASAAGSFLAVGLVMALLWPGLAMTAFWRLATPFSSAQWPKKTGIELDDFVKRIGRGREYRVGGTVTGYIPKEGTAEITVTGQLPQRRPFTIKTDDDGRERFLVHLRPDEIQRSFSFKLYAHDAETPEHAVEVLPLPQFVALDGKHSPQVTLRPPAYTDLPSPQHLSPGSGVIDAPFGTTVTVRAGTDRPLKRAWITLEPDTREALITLAAAPLAAPDGVGVLGSLALASAVLQPVEATLGQDRKSFTATFQPATHGQYTIHFEDENGLEGQRPYDLRLKPDPAPQVKLERPSPTRDSLSLMPTAEVPLAVAVEDSQYAARNVWLEYRVGVDGPVQRLDLWKTSDGLAADAAGWLGSHARAVPVPRLRLTRVEVARRLPLRLIKHADTLTNIGDRIPGGPLKEGDVVFLQVCADDFDDVTPFKEPGRSHAVEIRIVGRSAVQDIVRQEEGRLQQELAKARERQREAMAKVREMEARLRKDQKLSPEREANKAEADAQKEQDNAASEEEKAEKAATPEERQKHKDNAQKHREKAAELNKQAAELRRQAAQMAEALEAQQQVREKLNALKDEANKLREMLKQNGMENSAAMERADQVRRELERLADKELEQIEPKLNAARKMAEMQDEASRAERQKEMEAKARQDEREARAALEKAEKLEDRAGKMEKDANTAEGDEKSRLEKDAKKSREEALAEREKAARKLEDAKKGREDAKKPFNADEARKSLADARKGQEEVDKTLGGLLQDLETAASTREVKNEASRLTKEQKEAMAQLENIGKEARAAREKMAELEKEADKLEKEAAKAEDPAEKARLEKEAKKARDEAKAQGEKAAELDTAGKRPEELKPEQKAELEAAEEAQRKLEERTRQLLNKMKEFAESRAEKDPKTAKDIDDARKEAEDGKLAEKMKEASEAIKQNQLNKAAEKQKEALAELEKLAKNLEDKRDAELERLKQKLKKAEDEVEKLREEQEKLAKKIREAKDKPEELKKLAAKQAELAKRAGELKEELARLRNQRAAGAMAAVEEEMKEAVKKLTRGERDPEQQEDVLDRLEEARKEVAKAQKKAEEELGREQLARIADTLKAIRERQQGHVEEAKRIQDAALAQKGLTRGLKASLGGLGAAQEAIGKETEAIAKKELAGSPIFRRLLERVARDMERAAERAREVGRDAPPVEKLPDAELDRHQQTALRRLNQLLEAIKEQQQTDPRPVKGGDEDGGDMGGGNGGGGGDGLPPMAQLKLLKAMQEEVNARTADFRKRHPELDDLPPKAKAELEDIRREQKEVGDLLDRLTTPPGEEPGDEKKDDKKDEKKGEKKDEKEGEK